VLAPGSNVYHYDHIHVDLMRRTSRRLICQPAAMSGEEVAARAAGRNPYASREPNVTGSLGGTESRGSSQGQGRRGRRVRGRVIRGRPLAAGRVSPKEDPPADPSTRCRRIAEDRGTFPAA